MSHPGNDQRGRGFIRNTITMAVTPDQIGRLVSLIDTYGRHQYTLGQLNMINKSDRSDPFYQIRSEEKQYSEEARGEITKFIDTLIDSLDA